MPANEIELFMASIRALESGNGDPKGKYSAVGVYTGRMGRALGAYQIMSANWPNWAAQAGLPGADWRDPKAQDAVARYKMMQYYRNYGRWDAVAVAWFAGPGRVRDFLAGKNLSGTKDALGTSVPRYVSIINGYMTKFRPQYGPTGGSSAPVNDQFANEERRFRERAQAERAEGRGESRAETQGPAAARQPNIDNINYLNAINQGVGSSVDALGDFRLPELAEGEFPGQRGVAPGAVLTALLESVSNSIAGGQRSDPDEVALGSGFMNDQIGADDDEDPTDRVRSL